MALTFYTSVTKELWVGKFRELIPTFVVVTWEKLVGGFFSLILKKVKVARDNQLLFQNAPNNEIFEIFEMLKNNCQINVYYTKSKRL